MLDRFEWTFFKSRPEPYKFSRQKQKKRIAFQANVEDRNVISNN